MRFLVRKGKLNNAIDRRRYRWLKLLRILAIAYILLRQNQKRWGETSTLLSSGKFFQAAKCFRTQGDVTASERLEKRSLELQLENVYQQLPQKNIPSLKRTLYPQNAIQNPW